MPRHLLRALALVAVALVGCVGRAWIGYLAPDGGPANAGPADGAAAGDAGAGPDDGPDGGGAPGDGAAVVSVDALLALTSSCTVASNGAFPTDPQAAPSVDICRLNGAYFWKADMDISCGGQPTPECNPDTDPWFGTQTSFTQSDGQSLIAAQLPFILIPEPDSRFDYAAAGIPPGAAAIVIYDGRVAYGVLGDTAAGTVGLASYAMAASLGIDPDPVTGGVSGGVTYFVFTGADAAVSPIESAPAAVSRGAARAARLLQEN